MPSNNFELLREQTIESLNIRAQEFRHIKTGATHIHLDADVDENVFLVALRTVPEDSTGVAHILEHTALCGSEKYPVRDPFFMMIRRSLNTFMNAFTSSDWTAYPFASENKKDYLNLLDVYLDAVFFTNLDELDFRQEGHRVEFEDSENPESDLVYKGVVYNEMKGALSSPVQKLWADFSGHLFETSTYHHNSGGDPKNIVDLKYNELKDFYKKHYHPSNAIFMTFGNIPVTELQEKFESAVLKRFDISSHTIEISPEDRWSAPKSAVTHYVAEEGETDKKTHNLVGWLLGESSDLEKQLEAHLVSNLLLENSASPLRKALEKTKLGIAPSPLCGLEDTSREMVFVCGVEGSEPGMAQELEQLVLDTLNKTLSDGIDEDKVEAVLHQLELSQREIGGDHYPYGLQLILGSLPAAVHKGNPLELLDIDPVLQTIRKNIKDPEYVPGLIRDLLINNQHRLNLSMVPDSNLGQQNEAEEKSRLQALKDTLDDSELKSIIEQSKALEARQNAEDDPGLLPKVTLKDVAEDIHTVSPVKSENQETAYKAGTNGICYFQIVSGLPEFTDIELQYLPLFANLLTELGIGDQDYLKIQDKQTATTGGISAWLSYKADLDDVSKLSGTFVVSGKSLNRNQQVLEELVQDTLTNIRLDERDRIYDLVSQLRTRKEQSITGSGHSLAMIAASAYWSKGMALNHELSGLQSTLDIKTLHDSLANKEGFDDFIAILEQIKQKLIAAPKQTLLVNDQNDHLLNYHLNNNAGAESHLISMATTGKQNIAWTTNTQVNFCAKAYNTVSPSHPDSAPLTVLSGLLRNGYLHRVIREQGGAYGGGASHDPTNGVFRFYSYRDPRLSETLKDFDSAIQWFIETDISEQMLEEAILGIVSSIDKPGSPAGEAKQDFHNRLYGRGPEQRKKYRSEILKVTVEDLKRVCNDWLIGKPSSTAVVTSVAQQDEIDKAGLTVIKI